MKAQIKMFETVAVVIVFFFLIAISLRFYASVEMSNFENMQQRFNQLDSLKISMIVSNLHEIKCSISGVQSGPCFDMHKLHAFRQSMEIPEVNAFYTSMIGYANISVTMFGASSHTISVYEHIPDNYTGTLMPSIVPIVVENSITRIKHLGFLRVDIYEDAN
ncbi:MAG: hypothetical protein ACMXYC_02670 [Candidatus Woesearchaeota archaeon]